MVDRSSNERMVPRVFSGSGLFRMRNCVRGLAPERKKPSTPAPVEATSLFRLPEWENPLGQGSPSSLNSTPLQTHQGPDPSEECSQASKIVPRQMEDIVIPKLPEDNYASVSSATFYGEEFPAPIVSQLYSLRSQQRREVILVMQEVAFSKSFENDDNSVSSATFFEADVSYPVVSQRCCQRPQQRRKAFLVRQKVMG